MKILSTMLLAFFVSSCCTLDEAKYLALKNSVRDIEESHELIVPKYMEYVNNDASLTAEQKNDEKLFTESLDRLVERFKKAIENMKPD